MTVTRNQAKAAVRRRLARVSTTLPDGGPDTWQHAVLRARVAEARRLLRGEKDPGAALALLAPVIDRCREPRIRARALAVAAEARSRLGDRAGALEDAKAAVGSAPEFAALLVHARLTAAHGERVDALAAAQALIEVRPRNQRELREVLDLLHETSHETVARYRHLLHVWGLDEWEPDLAEADAALDLRSASEEELEREIVRVTAWLNFPGPVVARALDRRREWGRLADWAAAQPLGDAPLGRRRAAGLELRKAASRALTAGYTGPARTLASQALALRPDDSFAVQTWAAASDQLDVVRDGWAVPHAVEAPHFESRPKAVLSVLAQSLPLTSGGYATRSHGVLTGLADRGWEVEAVTRLGFPYDRWPKADPRIVAPYDEVDGIRYHRVLEPGRREYPQHPLESYTDRYAAALVAHARRHRPQLLHASSFHVNGLATARAAARLGLPYLYEMRGLEDLMKVSRDPLFNGSDRRRFLDTVEGASCAGAERVFVITEALGREMAARGVPEEKLVVLPNGVHTARFTPRARDAELELALGVRGKTVIGYAGGLVDYEGLELLLEAVAALKTQRSDFHVVVVGDGHHQGVVHATAARLRLGDVVTFTGRVPHDQVARYLSLFDITPFPRLPLPVCEMISPIKPFEAMATGRAVVVSSVAALTEIVRDGETGLVFAKGSATDLARVLGVLLDDPERRRELGEKARAWVRRERDWSRVVDIVDATYAEVLDARGGRGISSPAG